ncbi:MAG: HAD family acid phosphatase [Weeksellaceae bacterium]
MDTLPKAIICDLDGTLALLGKRSPYDASTAEEDSLNNPIANILEVYSHQETYDIKIILLTGREDKYREQTQRWLQKHNIIYEELYMRRTGDRRKDTVYKKEIYQNQIEGKYDVLFVLEDRDQVVAMWRKDLGLTCLQVEYGDF